MAEELIYKVGVEGTNELNKLEQSVDKAGKTTNKTTDYFQKMRMELRAARGDMLKYAEGTEEYNKALNKAAAIQGRMKDTNDKVRASTQDLGDTTKNITGAMVGFAGGFQVVQSAMSLFGIENEETIKTILKLQQTMAIVQGMSAFANSIDNMQDLLAGFRASNHQLDDELKNTSDGMEGVSKSSDSMGDSFKASGKESAVLGSNLAGNTKIADDLSKGLGGIGDGLNTLNTQQLKQSKELIQSNLTLLENTKKDIESKIKNASETDRLLAKTARWGSELDETNLKITEQNKKLSELDEQLTNTGKAQEKVEKGSKGAGKGINAFTKSILTSLGTMATFLAVIALVTWGISALIKWMAKIPEDIKVDIEISQTVQEQLSKDKLAVQKFANDYRKAWKDNDEKRLEGMAKIAKEEYNMSDERLKLITDTEDG